MAKKSPFSRGYQECRERLNKNAHYTRSCFNCAFYYQSKGDKDEVCQNDSVLQYDMVVDGNTIYCLKWQPNSAPSGKSDMFKKTGRSRLD